jgi:glutamine amidotransferase
LYGRKKKPEFDAYCALNGESAISAYQHLLFVCSTGALHLAFRAATKQKVSIFIPTNNVPMVSENVLRASFHNDVMSGVQHNHKHSSCYSIVSFFRLAYQGSPQLLYDLIFGFKHSLVVQSKHSTLGAETLNGDGIGVGWYHQGRENPILYRSVEPAWHDKNLKEISDFVIAPTVFAHIRAASPGVSVVQQSNCHPFRHENWLWMHNGVIRGFGSMKRDLLYRIDPELFSSIQGSTDSEAFFYLALTFGLQEDPPTAVAKAVGFIKRVSLKHGVENPVQMTVAVTDGKRMWAFRYSSEGNSRSLYYSSEKSHILQLYPVAEFPEVATKLDSFDDDSRLIVSEPLGDLPGVWNKVPESTCVFVDGGKITLMPFEPLVAE